MKGTQVHARYEHGYTSMEKQVRVQEGRVGTRGKTIRSLGFGFVCARVSTTTPANITHLQELDFLEAITPRILVEDLEQLQRVEGSLDAVLPRGVRRRGREGPNTSTHNTQP